MPETYIVQYISQTNYELIETNENYKSPMKWKLEKMCALTERILFIKNKTQLCMVFIHAIVIFDEKIWMVLPINNHKIQFMTIQSSMLRLGMCMCLCWNAIENSNEMSLIFDVAECVCEWLLCWIDDKMDWIPEK